MTVLTPQTHTQTPFEYARKSVHMLSLLIPFIIIEHLRSVQFALLFFIIFYSIAEILKLKGHTGGLNRLIGSVQREEERDRLARAPLFLAIGILFAISFFSREASLLGIYMVGFSDTFAAFCGKKWGSTKIFFFNRKTVVGTLCFFISAMPVSLHYLPPSKAVVLSLVGAFLESLPFHDWDNLTIPVVVTLLAAQFMG